jgi:hypothetical protein
LSNSLCLRLVLKSVFLARQAWQLAYVCRHESLWRDFLCPATQQESSDISRPIRPGGLLASHGALLATNRPDATFDQGSYALIDANSANLATPPLFSP